jgi:hypothetical protein
MANLTRAHNELFRRNADERFTTLTDLSRHCRAQKLAAQDRWHPMQNLKVKPIADSLQLSVGTDGAFALTDWSFQQLCSLAGITKDTVNRLSPETASSVFSETLPQSSNKPYQLFTSGEHLRSIHGVAYTRLWNIDLVSLIQEFSTDFQPPQTAAGGGTGLYAGEQDLFVFMIDPTGWAEIDGQAFAPGFFAWNSEVGKRSIGISTFWFQAVCQNHIVWDAIDVVDVNRKHTAKVHDALGDVRRAIDGLITKRDARRDGFVQVIRKAMGERLGNDTDEVLQTLSKQGIKGQLAKRALEIARQQGGFTIFALVDALTRIAQEQRNAGDRLIADESAAKLLALAV